MRDLQNAALHFEHEFFLLAQWFLLVKQARNLIERVMCTTAGLVLLRRWNLNVRDLDSNRRLTRQRKHLVRGDPGNDRSIAATSLANRFLHAAGPKFSDVSQHRGETLFPLGYVLSFTPPDGAHGML
jgi:hypothetical protein